MICAKKVKSVSDIGYVYRVNDISFSANIKKPFVLYTSSILYPSLLLEILDRYGDDAPIVIRDGVMNEIKTEVNGFFKKYLSFGKQSKREVYSLIRHNNAKVWKLNEYMNRKQKIAFLSRKMGYGIFDTIVKKLFIN